MASITRKRRRWMIAGSLIVLAVTAYVIAQAESHSLGSRARRAWRDQAVAKVRARYDDKAWLVSELARLRPAAAAAHGNGGAWVGDELLVTRNGDWMVCQNVCSKEEHTSVKRDLFIGRGSDGKWYYSTFHFCVGKCVLQMEPQPESLSQFVAGYWLVPFDGTSDDSLNETWAGRPWGVSGGGSTSETASGQR